MNFDWFDAWPAMALLAFILLAGTWRQLGEWFARRAARRRARVLLAPAPDMSGCIQRASMARQQCGMERNGHF